MVKAPAVPIDGVFAPKKKDTRIWQEKVRDAGNEWGNYLLGPHGQSIFEALGLASSFSPGQAIEDTLDASGTLSKGVMNKNPWEAGMGIAGLLGGILPGKSKLNEFPVIHGSQHKFASTENNLHGEFDLKHFLTGERTAYEGKGTYVTDPENSEVASTYAFMGPSHPTSKIDGTTIEDMKQEFLYHPKNTKDGLHPDNATKINVLDHLDSFLHARLTPNESTKIDPFINEMLQTFSLMNEKHNLADYDSSVKMLESLKGKEASLLEPGGWIYNAIVKDSPDNFINMHLPIQYQDNKIITAVDEWLKKMPISRENLKNLMPIDGKRTEQAVRDHLRRTIIDDEYNVPKKAMSALLQNEYMNEHMDIIKDQGVLGQKWFANTPAGGKARSDVTRLFRDLEDINGAQFGDDFTGFYAREDIVKEIERLTNEIETMPLTNSNMDKMFENQFKLNTLNMRLQDYVPPDDVAEKLFKIYNDPKVKYNYTINDPKKTTITNRKFYPK